MMKSKFFAVTGVFLAAGLLAFTFNRHSSDRTKTIAAPGEIDLTAPAVQPVFVGKKVITNIVLDRNNTVAVVGPIGPEAGLVAQAITQLSEAGNPIYVVINSPGGDVLNGALIVSAIQSARVPVYTVCAQLCASMASIIFEAGTKRMMVDRSILMFHPAAGGVEGTFPQMQSRLTFFNNFVNKMDSEIAKRVGLTLPEFTAKLNNELWLDAEDALKHHFSDLIVNVTLNFAGGDQGPTGKIRASQTKALKEIFNIRLGN